MSRGNVFSFILYTLDNLAVVNKIKETKISEMNLGLGIRWKKQIKKKEKD